MRFRLTALAASLTLLLPALLPAAQGCLTAGGCHLAAAAHHDCCPPPPASLLPSCCARQAPVTPRPATDEQQAPAVTVVQVDLGTVPPAPVLAGTSPSAALPPVGLAASHSVLRL